MKIERLTERELEGAIELWRAATAHEPPIFEATGVIRSVVSGCPALAAVDDEGNLLGTAVAQVEGRRAWLVRWVVNPEQRGHGIGSRLLDALLEHLRKLDVERVVAALPAGETGREAFTARGFSVRDGVTWFDRRLDNANEGGGDLAQLGAERVQPDLWDSLAGMKEAKALIERRVILPLEDPDGARKHGVEPPRAIVLFGPPGTGKTTFARGVAGRLSWPFVELLPSELATNGRDQQAAALRAFFERLEGLDRVVLFIDEVEEIAALRGGDSDRHQLTNELLKLVPRFRAGDRRLLICATNAVETLDPALRRPGRFDYLLPVGPPDADARRAIWSNYVSGAHGGENVDVEELVAASEGFTPADIEFTARKSAQRAFERYQLDNDEGGVVTDDYLTAIEDVGPSLDRQVIRAFEDDIDAHARL